MKKLLLRAAALVAPVVALAVLVVPAAEAQTTVTGAWNGGGTYTFNANTVNSTTAAVQTGGNVAVGSATYTAQGNFPYGYGVDTTKLDVNASVGSGGYIQSVANRTGSYTPLYGAAGQSITALAQSNDGDAALVQHVNVNYAAMNDIGYGQSKTAGGNTLDASGSAILLNYALDTGTANNNAGILVNASGSAGLNLSSSGVNSGGFGLGQGQGIFTQANFSGAGIGTVSTGGVATGSLSVANNGSTIFGTVANPASISTTINYATTGAQVQSWNFALGGSKQ
jgi:hypothetical protein